MRYRATVDGNLRAAMIWISDERGDPGARYIADDVYAGIHPDGDIVWIEILETNLFGSPFDDAAAERAIEFVEEQLASRPTA